jgi:hypothetical protein
MTQLCTDPDKRHKLCMGGCESGCLRKRGALMPKVEIVKVVKIFEKKVWIEDDIMGDKHVMVQHQDGKSDPFCYCSFHYDYGYTSNSGIRASAEKMAVSLGATEPVEYRHREFKLDV